MFKYVLLEDSKNRAFNNCTIARLVANMWSNKRNSVTVVDSETGEIMYEKKHNKLVWKSNGVYGKRTVFSV